MFLIGFSSAFIQEITTKTSIEHGAREILFTAKIKNIRLTSGDNIILANVVKSPISSMNGGDVKLKYDGDIQGFQVGSNVKIKANLIPVRFRVFPFDKSYENYAKLFGIIATEETV